jgi:hypothetical protein
VKHAHWFLLASWIVFAGGFLPFAMDEETTARAQESGSREKFDPQFPLPIPLDPVPGESGSQEKPGGVFPFDPKSPDPGHAKTLAPTPHNPADSSSTGDRGSARLVTTQFPNLIVPVAIFLAGLFLVGWSLFRMGVLNPYAATIWPKRLELCIEIALRIDDFMTAYREENFSKCQMSLDALNHLNGRRSILLSNEINAAVNKFVEHAVNAKISKDDEAFQKDFNRQYELVIESLRVGTRQEELTLEVLRSLTKAQGSHRRIKETPTDGGA